MIFNYTAKNNSLHETGLIAAATKADAECAIKKKYNDDSIDVNIAIMCEDNIIELNPELLVLIKISAAIM